MIKFTISGRLPSLNDYINVCRHNKYKAAAFKKQVDTQIITEIRKQRIGKAKTPVYIEFLWVEKDRRRDRRSNTKRQSEVRCRFGGYDCF